MLNECYMSMGIIYLNDGQVDDLNMRQGDEIIEFIH